MLIAVFMAGLLLGFYLGCVVMALFALRKDD